MSRSYLICLVLSFGCSKNPVRVEAPVCKLSIITMYADTHYPLTYNGTKIVKVGDNPESGSVLSYNSNGRLSTIEHPTKGPYYKTELFYNDEGRISIEKNYEKRGENWVENTVRFFTYTIGKVTRIRETVQWASPNMEFDHEIIWDGDNIHRIIIRSGATPVCIQQYSYDTTRKNPITAFIDLYYADNLGHSFKMPFYLSANLLIKEETNCPSVQTNHLTYDLSDSLHRKVYINGGEFLAYNYECR